MSTIIGDSMLNTIIFKATRRICWRLKSLFPDHKKLIEKLSKLDCDLYDIYIRQLQDYEEKKMDIEYQIHCECYRDIIVKKLVLYSDLTNFERDVSNPTIKKQINEQLDDMKEGLIELEDKLINPPKKIKKDLNEFGLEIQNAKQEIKNFGNELNDYEQRLNQHIEKVNQAGKETEQLGQKIEELIEEVDHIVISTFKSPTETEALKSKENEEEL